MLEIVVLPIDRHLSSKDFFQLCEKISLDALIVDTESWQEVSHHAHLDHCRAKHIPIIEWAKLTTRISLLEKAAVAVLPTRGSSNPPESIPAVLWFNHETGQSTLLSQRNLCQQAYQLQIVTDLQGSDVVFNAVGLQSCFGLLMGLLNPLMSGVTVVMMTRQFMPKFVIDSIYDTQSTILVADSSWLETYAPTEDTHYETMRLRATFTDHKVSDTTRSAWERHAKCYVFSALVDPNQAGIVSVNFPYFNHSTPFGRLLPLNELTHTKSGHNSSVSGPICPDYVVKPGQSTFGKNTSSCYQLSYNLAENQDGVLIESTSDAG